MKGANGKHAEGKAIWAIRNGSFLIDNQMGLMTADFDDTELTVEDSLFVKATKQKQPLPHLPYVGKIAKLQVTGSHCHQSHFGHLIKSRARENNIRYNLIYDGLAGSASYELEFPNGGIAYGVGNVIGQSAKTDDRALIAYGAEGWVWPDNVLYLSHNTLLSDQIGAWFLHVWPDTFPFPDGIAVKGINNLTVGVGVFAQGVGGEFKANFPALPSMLNAPEMLDFTLHPIPSYVAAALILADPSIPILYLAPNSNCLSAHAQSMYRPNGRRVNSRHALRRSLFTSRAITS